MEVKDKITKDDIEKLTDGMREPTLAEQKAIQDNIDKISVSTGVNFWREYDNSTNGRSKKAFE